jgi:hypothetical protein
VDAAARVAYEARMKVSLFCIGMAAVGLAPGIGRADNLLTNASFEQPKIEKRIDERQGGSPVKTDQQTSWGHYQSMDPRGTIAVGLTNEISRTGTQSIYVEYNKANAAKGAFLMSGLISVKAAENYRISIWGQLDRKRPLTLDQGRPVFRLEVEFYQADQESSAGETEYRTQMIPGSPNRVLFFANRWTEYFANIKSPEGAEFMKITFRWETPPDNETADGIIYFDDAVVEGPTGRLVPSDSPAPLPATPVVPGSSAPVPPSGAK